MLCNIGHNLHTKKSGFSLVEVLITSSIITIVTAIVIVKYGSFNSSILLKNQAYELALAIREAQVYSISIKGDGNAFRDAYGIYIDLNNPQDVIFFSDSGSTEKIYDSGDTILDTVSLDSRFAITEICTGSGCSDAGSFDKLSISFTRPDFDAYIKKINGSTPVSGQPSSATITIAPTDGGTITRAVTVGSSGQISVK